MKLIEQWARADIMSRIGRFDNLEYLDYAKVKLEKEDEIRELVLGTSDFIVLGNRWGMIKQKPEKRRKIKKKT